MMQLHGSDNTRGGAAGVAVYSAAICSCFTSPDKHRRSPCDKRNQRQSDH